MKLQEQQLALQIFLEKLFMMIMFIWHKVPFGVTTMTCCIILAAAGIFDVKTAFSGFGNKIVILIAPMLALSAVLTKTSSLFPPRQCSPSWWCS